MIERVVGWLDDRLGGAPFVQHALRKVFPDHWSFMLGEINVYCFVVLVATGTFLALFFDPAATKVVYHGGYRLLDGVVVSTAYASALHLSFDVNAGLLMRQIHHWTALIFVACIILHMARVFFTGAFRRPRELTWAIGVGLLALAIFEGFAGYSLPDDLLSGIGLRIAHAIVLSVPVIGTWAAFLAFGGAFPSPATDSRLFIAHVFIVPAALATLMGLHLALVWHQKHTQMRLPGRTEENVVGSPLTPNYSLRSFALGAGVLAITSALGAGVQINPIWMYGPYEAWKALSPAQPDWYMGWLEGALRIGPPWELHLAGHTIPPPFWPAVLMPSVVFLIAFLWPWIEMSITRDGREHNLCDGPGDAPARFAAGVALLTFLIVLTFAGSDDVQARYSYVSVYALVAVYRVLIFVLPALAGIVAYVIALQLRRHGVERQAKRVHLYRERAGGFEEEVVP